MKCAAGLPRLSPVVSLIALLIAFLAAGQAPGQELEQLPGFRTDILEVYLGRADRAQSRDGWIDIAAIGRQAAIADWERTALMFFETEEETEQARRLVEEAISRETDQRLAAWLIDRFFETRPNDLLGRLATTVRTQNMELLYAVDEDGHVLTDALGDPVLRGPQGLELERPAWVADVRASIEGSLAAWRSGVEAALPELLAEVPEGARSRFAETAARFTEQWQAGYRRELEAVAAQEELRFVARRSADQFSLRRKSEDQAAGEVAERLIAEARAGTEAGLRELERGLDGAAAPEGAADGSEVEIDPARWRESFRMVLEAGLAKWDKAEEQLLVERVEWEQRAGSDLRAGEEAWASAYGRLEAEREAWQEELGRALADGRSRWDARAAELSAAIQDAQGELARSLQTREQAMQERIDGLVTMYGQAGSLAVTARQSAGYWLQKLGLADALVGEEPDRFAAAVDAQSSVGGAEAVQQARYWKAVYDAQRRRQLEARDELANTLAIIVADDGERDPLKAVLGTGDATSEYLDTYQLELLRAKATAEYWDRQYRIAEAVYDYASGADRPTAAESRAAMDAALRAFQDRQSAYDEAVDALGACAGHLESDRTALAAAQGLLQERRSALERAEAECQAALLGAGGTSEWLAGELVDRYQALLVALGLEPAGDGAGETMAGQVADYLAAARRLGFEQKLEASSRAVSLLLRGNGVGGAAGSPALVALHGQLEAVPVLDGSSLPSEVTGFGIPADHPLFPFLLSAFGSWLSSADGSEEAAFHAQECILLTARYRARLQAALQEREDAIRLFAAPDLPSWYRVVTGDELGLDSGGAYDAAVLGLRTRGDRAEHDLLVERTELERTALALWRGRAGAAADGEGRPLDPRDPAQYLVASLTLSGGSLDVAEARAREGLLDRLLAVLEAPGHQWLSSCAEELARLAASDPWLAGFLAGTGSFAAEGGIDPVPLLLAEPSAAVDLASRRLSMLQSTWAQTPLGARAEEEHARGAVGLELVRLGLLADADELTLAEPACVAAQLSGRNAAEREAWLSDAIAGLRGASSRLPAYQGEQLEAWLVSLCSYAAALALHDGVPAGTVAEGEARLGEVIDEYDRLSGNPGSAERLATLALEIRKAEAALQLRTAYANAARQLADGQLNHRAYLVSAVFDDARSATGSLTSASVGTSLEADGEATHLGHVDCADPRTRAVENEVLDRYNDCIRCADGVSAAFALDSEALAAETMLATAFGERLLPVVEGEPSPADDIGPGFVVSSLTRQAYANAASALSAIQGFVAACEDDIVQLGRSWERSKLTDAELATIRADLDLRMQAAELACSEAEREVEDAIASFDGGSADYNTTFEAARQGYARLELARLELDTRQEIEAWAANAYLGTAGEGAAVGYRAPAQQVAWTEERKRRADSALEILSALFDDKTAMRTGSADDSGGYADAWRTCLAYQQVRGELQAEIVRQESLAERASLMYLDSLAEVFPKSMADSFADEADEGGSDGGGALSWSGFLWVDGGEVRLHYDSDDFELHEATAADLQALHSYFAGVEGEWEEDQRAWVTAMAARLGAGEASSRQMLTRWGLAADWLRMRLYERNRGGEGEPITVLLADRATADSFVADPLLRNFIATETHGSGEFDGYRDYLAARGAEAYADLCASPVERRLFELYLASSLVAGTTNTFLTSASELAVAQYLEQALSDAIQAHLDDSSTFALEGWALYALAVAMAWIPGAFPALALEAAIPFGLSIDAGIKAEEDRRLLAADVEPAVRNAESTFSTAVQSFGGSLGTCSESLDALEEGEVRLAELQGSGSEAVKQSLEAFEAQLVALYRQRGLGDPPLGDLDLARYYRDAQGTGFQSLLSQMAAAAESNMQREGAVLVARAETAALTDQEALAAWRQALAEYLGGEAARGEGELSALARRAFAGAGHDPLSSGVRMAEALLGTLNGGSPSNGAAEEARAALLQEVGSGLSTLYHERLAGQAQALQQEWLQRAGELADQRSRWEAAMGAAAVLGLSAWNQADVGLRDRERSWASGFEEAYRRRSLQWEGTYLGFLERKEQWVAGAAGKASEVGRDSVLREVEESGQVALRESTSSVVNDVGWEAPDPSTVLAELLGGQDLSAILASAQGLSNRIGNGQTTLWAAVKADDGLGSILARVHDLQGREDEELALRGILIVADQAREALATAREGYRRIVVEANGAFDSSMDQLFLGSFFTRSGGWYEREAIVGSTVLTGVLTEEQRVAVYAPFAIPAFNVTVDLSTSGVAGLDSRGVEARLDRAIQELEAERYRIFEQPPAGGLTLTLSGTDYTEEVDDGFWGEIAEGWRELWNGKEGVAKTVSRQVGPGEFGMWIGYEPEFAVRPDPTRTLEFNLVVAGEGELGRLMREHTWDQIRAGVGFDEMARPLWDKRLWDDRGSWVKSPTIRSTVDLGVSVAAAFTGNVWAIAALNLADDAVFGMADVAGGYRSGAEVALEFGKKATIGFGSALVGGVFGGVGELLPETGFASVVGRTALTGAQAFTTNALSRAVNAVTWNAEAGWGFDASAFGEGTFGGVAVAGYLSGMTGSFATGTLDLALNGFVNDTLLNGRSLDALVGGIAGQAVSYGMTGEATFNLANIGSRGLVELHVGGDGATMNLGSGGADISGGTLLSAARGLEAWGVNARLLLSGEEEARRYASAMRTLYSTGIGENAALYREILAGTTNVVEERAADYGARTFSDEATGSRTIALGRDALSDTSRFALNVVLSHESFRNGVDDSAIAQVAETDRAVLGHIAAAAMLARSYGAASVGSGLIGEVQAFAAALRGDATALAALLGGYDTSADFWRMRRDPRTGHLLLENDRRATLTDEHGNTLINLAQMGLQSESQIEQALAYLTGMRASDAGSLMPETDSGLDLNARGLHLFGATMNETLFNLMFNKTAYETALRGRGSPADRVALTSTTVETMIASGQLADPSLSRYFSASQASEAVTRFEDVVAYHYEVMDTASAYTDVARMDPTWRDAFWSMAGDPNYLNTGNAAPGWEPKPGDPSFDPKFIGWSEENPDMPTFQSYCNILDYKAVSDAALSFLEFNLARQVFLNGLEGANALGEMFAANPYLILIDDPEVAQQLANDGGLVIPSYINPSGPGHVGLLAPTGTPYWAEKPSYHYYEKTAFDFPQGSLAAWGYPLSVLNAGTFQGVMRMQDGFMGSDINVWNTNVVRYFAYSRR